MSKNRILLVDASTTGHHIYYNSILINKLSDQLHLAILTSKKKIYTGHELYYFPITEKKSRILKNLWYTIFVVYSFILAVRKKMSLIHFLSGDDNFIALAITVKILSILTDKRIVITMHWYRNNKKIIILKNLIKNDSLKIVCHGEFIKEKFVSSDIESKKISSIEYPISGMEVCDKLICRKKLNIDPKERVLLVYGGLRFDKGVDIAINGVALSESKPLLLIAGAQDHFKIKDIENMKKRLNLDNRIRYDAGYIQEDLTKIYFAACDAVLIPYRKEFGGQSGILSESVAYNKPVIAAKTGQLEYEVKKYKLGLLFIPESDIDLGKTIDEFYKNEITHESWIIDREKYLTDHSITQFVNNYLNIYQN